MTDATSTDRPDPVYVPHPEFKNGVHQGRFKLIVNPELVHKFVRHKLFINGISIPESINADYKAHYFDFDLYGTVNFNRYVGAQVGYRSIDVGYKFKKDEGTFKMKGLYFGGVARY